MSSSDPLNGDDWADLAQELGVSETDSTPPPLPDDLTAEVIEEVEYTAVEAEPDDELEDELEESSEEEGGEGEPKKRRRRRRRRKKKTGPEVAAVASESDSEEEGLAPSEEDDETGEEEFEAEPLSGESLEDSSPEAARELIRTWNVPSWDEIVTGLYRPDR